MPNAIQTPTNARSRRTRSAILAAARSILEDDGFEALTMGAVADRASISRRAVYMHFGSRSELIGSLFDHVAAAESLEDSLQRVWAAPDAAAALEEWAAHIARYHPRLLAVDRALQRVRHSDADAAAHRKRVVAEQLANCRRLADRLADEHMLVPPWNTASAADMLFALVSSDIVEALLVDRRWSQRRLATHIGLMLRSTFVKPA